MTAEDGKDSSSSGSVESIPASAGGLEDGLDRDAAFFLGLIIFGAVVFVAAVATVLFRVICQSFFAICLPHSSMSQVFLRVKDSAFPKKLATLTGSRSSTSKAPRPTPNGNMWVTPHDKNRQASWLVRQFGKLTNEISVRDYDDYYKRKFTTHKRTSASRGSLERRCKGGGGDGDQCSCCNLPPWAVPTPSVLSLDSNEGIPKNSTKPQRISKSLMSDQVAASLSKSPEMSFDSYRTSSHTVVHNNMLSASNLQPLLQRSQGVDEQQQTKRSIQRGYHKSGGYYGPVLDPSARPKGRHGIAADNAKNYEQSYANHRRKSVY